MYVYLQAMCVCIYIYTHTNIVICKQIDLLFCIYFCNNVAFVYWRLKANNRNLQYDSPSLHSP